MLGGSTTCVFRLLRSIGQTTKCNSVRGLFDSSDDSVACGSKLTNTLHDKVRASTLATEWVSNTTCNSDLEHYYAWSQSLPATVNSQTFWATSASYALCMCGFSSHTSIVGKVRRIFSRQSFIYLFFSEISSLTPISLCRPEISPQRPSVLRRLWTNVPWRVAFELVSMMGSHTVPGQLNQSAPTSLTQRG